MFLINGDTDTSPLIYDRGLLFGDGVFETIRVRSQRIELWSDHILRLQQGCQRLGFVCPDESLLLSDVEKLLAHASEGVLRITVTRGSGERGYRPLNLSSPCRILHLSPLPEFPEAFSADGIELGLCATRMAQAPRLAGIKHLNRLEQVLARMEWQSEYQESLVLDESGWVIEGTMSNLFLLNGNVLSTPELSRCGVSGVVRKRLLTLAAAQGFTVCEALITLAEVDRSEALFMTNSVIGLWPVRRFRNKRCYAVPATLRHLQAGLEDLLQCDS